MSRLWLLAFAFFWGGNALTGQTTGIFRHAALDRLVPELYGIGTASKLLRIDSVLLALQPNAAPELLYFLRRYRCEQLYYQGLLDESMVEAETASRIAIELKDSALIASSLNQMAVLLEERNEDAQGIAMLKEALRLYPARTGHVYPLATPYRIQGNLGLCWANLGEIDSARFCQQRSLALAQDAHVPRGEALALLELGRLEMLGPRTDSALLLFDRSITMANGSGNLDVLLDALAAKAEAYAGSGRVEEMESSLNAGQAVMDAHADIAPRSVLAFLKMEVRSLAKAGRYKAALAAARSWGELDRQMRSAGARTAQRILKEMHATDAGLAEVQDHASIMAAEVKAEERIRSILTIGAALVTILLVALVLIFIARSRQKARLSRLSVIQAEQERQIADLQIQQQVAEDLHDDLGAGLSALKLNSELAADLCTDPTERTRTRSLATIAGNLIAIMRHILWALGPSECSIKEMVTYITDRARAFCAEHDRSVTIKDAGDWPMILASAEVRHLAWPVVRDALDALMKSEEQAGMELHVHWNDGLLLTIRSNAKASLAQRSQLADRITDHHLQVSRIGGWLRTPTEGSPRLDVFLPCMNAHQAADPGKNRSRRILTGALMIACSLIASSLIGQGNATYRHPVLDRMLSEVSMGDPWVERINNINSAIMVAEPMNDDRLTCHLLLSRANQMYYQGLYDMGIADVNRALELAKDLRDSLLIATTYNMFGLLNENLNNDAVTLPWFRVAAQWLPHDTECAYPVVKDYHIDGNIAQCMLNMGMNDSAVFHYERSRDRASLKGNERALGLANLGLARSALIKGTTSLIPPLLDSAQAQALRCGSSDVYVNTFPVKAQYLLRTEGSKAAISALDEGLVFLRSDSTINRSSIRKFFDEASVLRENLGQYDEAYQAWQEWQQLDSSIRTTDDRAALTTLRIMLDNGQRLHEERSDRERIQAQLIIDRSLRSTIISTTAVTALLLLGLFALLVNRQRNQRNMVVLELERIQGRKELAQLRTRQRLSEDMLAELGTRLEALRIRSQLSSATDQGPEDRERMVQIAAQATELIESLKQIVWAMDTGRSTLNETLRFTAHYVSTYCTQQGLKLLLHLPSDPPELLLTMEQRRNIFLVVKEALHNVVKHARAHEVGLQITYTDLLAVRIRDDGHGHSIVGERAEGNGLRNMRKRIEAIGGTFNRSNDHGMVIHFTVPLSDNNGSTNGPGT